MESPLYAVRKAIGYILRNRREGGRGRGRERERKRETLSSFVFVFFFFSSLFFLRTREFLITSTSKQEPPVRSFPLDGRGR